MPNTQRASALKEKADKVEQRAEALDGRAAKSSQQARGRYARAEVLRARATQLERRNAKQ